MLEIIREEQTVKVGERIEILHRIPDCLVHYCDGQGLVVSRQFENWGSL